MFASLFRIAAIGLCYTLVVGRAITYVTTQKFVIQSIILLKQQTIDGEDYLGVIKLATTATIS
jgi:hypothetical protein